MGTRKLTYPCSHKDTSTTYFNTDRELFFAAISTLCENICKYAFDLTKTFAPPSIQSYLMYDIHL